MPVHDTEIAQIFNRVADLLEAEDDINTCSWRRLKQLLKKKTSSGCTLQSLRHRPGSVGNYIGVGPSIGFTTHMLYFRFVRYSFLLIYFSSPDSG